MCALSTRPPLVCSEDKVCYGEGFEGGGGGWGCWLHRYSITAISALRSTTPKGELKQLKPTKVSFLVCLPCKEKCEQSEFAFIVLADLIVDRFSSWLI